LVGERDPQVVDGSREAIRDIFRVGGRGVGNLGFTLHGERIQFGRMSAMQALIPPAEADTRIRAALARQPVIECPLKKAAGRVLLEPILADRDLPPFDRVTMDGIAVREADLPARRFRLVGRQDAGQPPQTLPFEPGSAIGIATGAVCPVGADCIVPREAYSEVEDGRCVVVQPDYAPPEARFVHRRASDAHQGAELVPAGTRLGPAEIGIAASCGLRTVRTAQNFRIALVSTGDELVPVEAEPLPHQIRRSNPAALETGFALRHHPAQTLVSVPDDPEKTREVLGTLLEEHDVLVVTGGISMGLADYVPGALDELGAVCRFHGVAQRPGKPFGFWTMGQRLVFTLPGNPVSALVCLHRYVLPALDHACGAGVSPTNARRLTVRVTFHPPLAWFLPVRESHDGTAEPAAVQNSGDYAALAGTTGFLELPAEDDTFAAGASFPYYRWAGA
jgi:molybdopterin molybdotransferase